MNRFIGVTSVLLSNLRISSGSVKSRCSAGIDHSYLLLAAMASCSFAKAVRLSAVDW